MNKLTTMVIIVAILIVVLGCQAVWAFNDLKTCHEALGMQSGKITASQLSVSSMRNRAHGPDEARIRTENNGGAWCPKTSMHPYEYIQVNLRQLHVITAIETQGRHGSTREFADYYRIEYTRDPINDAGNESEWIKYKNRDDIELIKGNENPYEAQVHELNRPIIVRQIRIIPVIKAKRGGQQQPTTTSPCLRLELYGCAFKDDIVSYELKDGDVSKRNDYNHQDKIYDGQKDYNTNRLYNGHGLLTDGDFGNDDFKQERYGIRGYDWLGWRNDSRTTTHAADDDDADDQNGPTVKIKFNFDTLRNFTLCIVYVNNRPSAQVELFSYVRMRFSIDGQLYTNELNKTMMRDNDMEMARPILIPINNLIGKHVELEFGFHSKFLLISEITFESTRTQPNYRLVNSLFLRANETTTMQQQQQQSALLVSKTSSSTSVTTATDYLNTLSLKTLVMALICSILFLILIVLVSFYYISQMNSRQAKNTSWSSCCCRRQRNNDTTKLPPTLENKSIQSGSYESTYLYPSLKYNMLTTLYRNQPKTALLMGSADQQPNNNNNYACVEGQAKFMKLVNTGNNAAGSSNMYYTIKPHHVAQLPTQPPPPPPLVPHPQAQTLSSVVTLNRPPPPPLSTTTTRTIPNSSITFLDKIGESILSTFYVGQILSPCQQHDESTTNDANNNNRRDNVLIKVLKNERDATMKYGFDNDLDMQILNKTKMSNTNLIELLGICNSDPYCYIVDHYSAKYNLYEYLANEYRVDPHATLTYASMLCVGVQVANAMSFLESANLIHKDLSCKNCIIHVNNNNYKPLNQLTRQDIVVKVCDLARYTYDYRQDYSILLTAEQQQQPLKLRWCAWETICTGKFTIKSDVWSFAVLLYEMQTMCAQLPYCEYADESLLALINQQTTTRTVNICGGGVEHKVENYLVKQLDQCGIRNVYTKELFDLMCQCWNLNLFDRPTFKDINLFLAFQLNGLNELTRS